MSPLHLLSIAGPGKGRAEYRQTLTAGCGHVAGHEHARLAAPKELVVLVLEQAVGAAQANAGASRVKVAVMPVGRVVVSAVDATAALAMALHRDRPPGPGESADALGSMLVLYVAGAGEVN